MEESKNKVLSNFENVMTKLTAIVGGENNLKPIKKITKNATLELVEGLFKEERLSKEEEVKSELKTLLKAHVTLTNSLEEERKKLDKLEIQKKKEFNASASKLFNKIEGLNDIAKQYTKSFNEAIKGSTENK